MPTPAELCGPLVVTYGSPEYDALPGDDPRRHDALVHAAECWRTLRESPHVADLIADWVEWDSRRHDRDFSRAVSAGFTYRDIAGARAEPGRLMLEFRKRHGGEYRGGPVDWATGRPA